MVESGRAPRDPPFPCLWGPGAVAHQVDAGALRPLGFKHRAHGSATLGRSRRIALLLPPQRLIQAENLLPGLLGLAELDRVAVEEGVR